ncbi:MAG: radical SAM protein [Chitinivibrionales bacterium]|nr:radical SAM protein [Chitinivibrionales bacterium]MBD3358847.1 radical SAM protein [Chitinivibrionales bacterium]
MAKRDIRIGSKPYLLILDTINRCNLRCPLCPTGTDSLNRPRTRLDFERFRAVFDGLKHYLFEVNLYNWGEPFLNKDIYRMIAYAKAHNVGTSISSNLNIIKPDDLDSIISSGLEYLVVSLDATTPQVYDTYRKAGDFNTVMNNLRLLLRKRGERRVAHPMIEWQFIVMKSNMHQQEDAVALARDIGVDVMRFIPVGLPFDTPDKASLAREWYPVSDKSGYDYGKNELQYGQSSRKSTCYYLYRSATINPDGGVSPCCVVYDSKYDFGNAFSSNFDEIWNNERFQSARALFSRKKISAARNTPCYTCPLFDKSH